MFWHHRYDPWDGDFADGKMQLYDTGMASMVVMDTDALAALAKIISRSEATMLHERADSMRALIETRLWDDEAGACSPINHPLWNCWP